MHACAARRADGVEFCVLLLSGSRYQAVYGCPPGPAVHCRLGLLGEICSCMT
jgi:hypothetical protein